MRFAVLSGSIRSGSFNTALARLGALAYRDAGAEVDLIDLAGLDMPIYNGDLEKTRGLPAAAAELRERLKAADGFLIASPEHNMSVSALLKNAIDWTSRAVGQELGRVPYDGKTAALCSASTGGLGGQRGLMHLRMVLTGIGVHVLPGVVGIPSAAAAFDTEGQSKDAGQAASLRALVQSSIETTRRLRGAAG